MALTVNTWMSSATATLTGDSVEFMELRLAKVSRYHVVIFKFLLDCIFMKVLREELQEFIHSSLQYFQYIFYTFDAAASCSSVIK